MLFKDLTPQQNELATNLEDYQLHNQDCMKILKSFADESVDLICTDPPYPITSRGNAGTSGGMMQKKQSLEGKIFEHNNIDCEEYAPEFFRVLKPSAHCYVMTNHINLIHMLNVFTDCGFHFVKSLIWNKGNKIMGRFYMNQFEYILFFRKDPAKPINFCGTSDILSIPNVKHSTSDGNAHDTEKPVDLMKILVKNSSQHGELVMDPFMGIGSTGVACKELNRKFVGCEIDEKYYKIAEQRILC